MAYRLDTRHAAFAEEFETLLGSKREVSEEVGTIVAAILNDVRLRGDEAVLACDLHREERHARARHERADVLDGACGDAPGRPPHRGGAELGK